MTKSLALFLSIVAAGTFAITTAADARTRYFGPRAYYPLPPPSAPGWRETPMYAPDAPPPRYWNNPGLPDFQLGERN
jgi:hypothetical protein